MYKVVRYFEDITDNRFPYDEGDTYPREGVKPTKERIEELSSEKNAQGVALIKKVTYEKKSL